MDVTNIDDIGYEDVLQIREIHFLDDRAKCGSDEVLDGARL